MRQHIIKRNKTIFVFLVWAVIIIAALPWAYKNVFISEEGFVLRGQTCSIPEGLSDYVGEARLARTFF